MSIAVVESPKTKKLGRPRKTPDAVPSATERSMAEPHQPSRAVATIASVQPITIQSVAIDGLVDHDACAILPRKAAAALAVRNSVQALGILQPLVITSDRKLLDGRYRLAAARELGHATVNAIIYDPSDPIEFVFHCKDAREHLNDHDRAVLAVQYQRMRSKQLKAVRTAAMNAARLTKVKASASDATALISSSDTGSIPAKKPKQDSLKEACERYNVPERTLRAVKRMAEKRPKLFEQVVAGTLSASEALKKVGKNVERDRVATAIKAAVRPVDIIDGEIENRIHVGEAAEVLKRVQDNSASLVLCSPPYHGVPIEYDPPLPAQSYAEYLADVGDVLSQAHRVSRSGGRLAVVIDTVHNPGAGGDADEMLPLFADIVRLAREFGWRFWVDLAWKKPEVSGSKTTFGSLARCSAPGWGRDHEWILIFFKEQKKLDGDVNLCDLDRVEHRRWWQTAWEITGETRKEILAVHPAPYPEELAERLIKLLTHRRDLVIDPYNGSGTTTAVAARLQRRFIGIDRSEQYCAFARERTKCLIDEAEIPHTENDGGAAAVSASDECGKAVAA